MNPVNVLAFITTKPGMRDAVLEAFKANVPKVHAEDGCIEYFASVDTEDAGPIQTPVGPDSFVVIEKWESMDHLKAHGGSAHMKAYAQSVKDMLADRVIRVLSAA
ncbi:MAG: antibiotic biosynthesis monooxygenase [Gammaproteobacteria bacterium]|nr:antibiotic biosynthesis monooxygenase [Gammaproteobacteria bacterium]